MIHTMLQTRTSKRSFVVFCVNIARRQHQFSIASGLSKTLRWYIAPDYSNWLNCWIWGIQRTCKIFHMHIRAETELKSVLMQEQNVAKFLWKNTALLNHVLMILLHTKTFISNVHVVWLLYKSNAFMKPLSNHVFHFVNHLRILANTDP
jgi:hypothetical protein